MTARLMTSGLVAATVWGIAAASVAAPPIKSTFRNENTNFFFSELVPIACAGGGEGTLETSGFISAFASVVRGDSGIPSSSDAFAFVGTFNSCTFEATSASAVVANPDFIQQRTNSSALDVTFTLTDSSGASAGTLKVDVVLNGFGSETRTSSRSLFHTGDMLIKFQSKGSFRSATVAGTVSLDGVEYVDNVQSAELANTREGQMIVQH